MDNMTRKQKMAKLPDDAMVAHSGYLFRIWQWTQVLFDKSTSRFELCECRGAVLVIAEMGGNIHFTRQRQSGLVKTEFNSLFGGYIDDGETPLATGKRELLEEGGMESDDWELICEYNPNDKFAKTDYYYIARNCRIAGTQKLDAAEKIKVVNLPMDEFFRTIPFDKKTRDGQVLRSILCTEFSGGDMLRAVQLIKGNQK